MKSIIESACSELSKANTFSYAEKYELNIDLDNVETWPAICLLPILMTKKKNQVGEIETEHFIQMVFVQNSNFLGDSEAEKLPIVEALEVLIEEFIARLEKKLSMRLKKFTDIQFKLLPVGNNFDAVTDGYYLEAKLFSYRKTVCP
jgi:hypothetical protein